MCHAAGWEGDVLRTYAWSIPCLFALGALSACSANVGGATPVGSGGAGGGTETTGGSGGGTGGSGGGTGGSGTSTGAGGDLPIECPAPSLTAGACLVPAAGFAGDPPEALDLVATVTEIGEGVPPFGCWESPVTFINHDAPGQVWARLEDETSQEWAVSFAVPTLQAGFNGHIAVGDTVNVSLSWILVENDALDYFFPVADLAVSRDDLLVAYVSQYKAPPWYTKDQAVCHVVEACCASTSFDAIAEVGGATGVVPNGGMAEVGGLAITNLAFDEVVDVGCCDNDPVDPLRVAAAAVPAP
jgi:hypothetical protein